MEFKTEEELIEMGKCQLIRLVLDLQNEIKLLEYAIIPSFSYPFLTSFSSGAVIVLPRRFFYIYIFKKT